MRIRYALAVALAILALVALRPANRTPVHPRQHSGPSGQLAGPATSAAAPSAILGAAPVGTTDAQTLASGDPPRVIDAASSARASEDDAFLTFSRPVLQRNLPLLI